MADYGAVGDPGDAGNGPDGSCTQSGLAVSLVTALFRDRILRATEVGTLREETDMRFHDRVALDEIELYAEVLSAVAAADGPLTIAELDEVLGLCERADADVAAS